MSTDTKIEWCDHTFNPWHGCTKVHEGCTNCYAEAQDRRWAGKDRAAHWGDKADRRMVLGEWGKPIRWNFDASQERTMRRVFCASMADLFEDYDPHRPVVDMMGKPITMPEQMRVYWGLGAPSKRGPVWTVPALRRRVFDIIEATGWLWWLLLTKRPENIREMVPAHWLEEGPGWPKPGWPRNVMTGTSPASNTSARPCIDDLLKVPGRHFLSCEPLLGELDLRPWIGCTCAMKGDIYKAPEQHAETCAWSGRRGQIHEIIVGGESKQAGRCRPCNVEWIEDLITQGAECGVPVFVKQLGSDVRGLPGWNLEGGHKDSKGGDPEEWPECLRVRQQAFRPVPTGQEGPTP